MNSWRTVTRCFPRSLRSDHANAVSMDSLFPPENMPSATQPSNGQVHSLGNPWGIGRGGGFNLSPPGGTAKILTDFLDGRIGVVRIVPEVLSGRMRRIRSFLAGIRIPCRRLTPRKTFM